MLNRKGRFSLDEITGYLIEDGYTKDEKVFNTDLGECLSYTKTVNDILYCIRFYKDTLMLNKLNTLFTTKLGASIYFIDDILKDILDFNKVINLLFPYTNGFIE